MDKRSATITATSDCEIAILNDYDMEVFFRRLVPLDNKVLSKVMKNSAPLIEQLFIKGKSAKLIGDKLNIKLFIVGKIISNKISRKIHVGFNTTNFGCSYNYSIRFFSSKKFFY